MKRIDFLGAPGVGKSTLYLSLLNNRKNKDIWISPQELLEFRILEEISKRKSSKFNIIKFLGDYLIFFKPLSKIYLSSKVQALLNHAFSERKDSYNELIGAALSAEQLIEKEHVRRLLGITWFFDVLKTVSVVETSNLDKLVLFDESICQKVFGITNCDFVIEEQKIQNYFSFIPLPDLLVYFYLDPELNYNRIINRQKIIPSHKNLNMEELQKKILIHSKITDLGTEVLKDRGCKVLKLDMSKDLNLNLEFLHKNLEILRVD
jgi:hypothetical protein